MSSYSDRLSLIKVHTSIEVVVAARDDEDAKRVVMDNYCDIIDDMFHKGSLAELEIHGYETIDELDEDSPLRYYTPHGDEYGGQYTCEYYTTVEKDKREKEEQERNDKVEALIAGLDEKSLELLRNHFISDEN